MILLGHNAISVLTIWLFRIILVKLIAVKVILPTHKRSVTNAKYRTVQVVNLLGHNAVNVLTIWLFKIIPVKLAVVKVILPTQ